VTAIRQTTPADLDFVLEHEHSPAATPYIAVWTRNQDGIQSLAVMSILDREWEALRAAN